MEENSSKSPSKEKTKFVSNENSNSNSNSLPISTSSSWTILPPDKIEILDNSSSEDSSVPNTPGAETEPKQEPEQRNESANEQCKRDDLEDTEDAQTEDQSDGISIISDCESTGRISPHPYLREHLHNLSFKFDPAHELPQLDHLRGSDEAAQQIRERRRTQMELSEDESSDGKPASSITRPGNAPVVVGYQFPSLLQNGLTAVFYVCATLAILSFVGRLRNPEWQDSKPLGELEQRLVELELQNNLMRAEIDIISKQMSYLTSLAGSGNKAHGQTPAHGHEQSQGRKVKTFKAWAGNGNGRDPVDITKADLKRPYKCPDGKYVEIAAMCVENKPHAESLVDEIGNVVNDVLQQSQAFQNFEKVTERLGTLAMGNNEPNKPSDSSKTFHAHGEKPHNSNPAIDPRPQGPMPVASNKNQRPNSSSKERYHKHQDHSKEFSHQRFKSNENDSKERHSRERKYIDKSKEYYGKKRHHHGDDSDGSGEWHERMMQHRENARQRHDQKRNNNWYIERGGSREQKRSGETRR